MSITYSSSIEKSMDSMGRFFLVWASKKEEKN